MKKCLPIARKQKFSLLRPTHDRTVSFVLLSSLFFGTVEYMPFYIHFNSCPLSVVQELLGRPVAVDQCARITSSHCLLVVFLLLFHHTTMSDVIMKHCLKETKSKPFLGLFCTFRLFDWFLAFVAVFFFFHLFLVLIARDELCFSFHLCCLSRTSKW